MFVISSFQKRLEGKQKKKTPSFAKVTCESHIIMKKIARFPNYKVILSLHIHYY